MFLCRSAVTMASIEEMQIVEETKGDQINDYKRFVKLGIDDRVVEKLQEVCSEGISKVCSRRASAATPRSTAVADPTTPRSLSSNNKRGRRRDRSASTEEEEAESQLPPTAVATPVQLRRTKSAGRVATPTVASGSGSSSASKASRSKRSRLMQQPTLPSVADDDEVVAAADEKLDQQKIATAIDDTSTGKQYFKVYFKFVMLIL